MAGHSHWANIKYRKGTADARRSKMFTRLLKEVYVAARLGGPVLEGNPRLKIAVQNARAMSVPKENIEKNIKKATGEGAENYTEITYECYGPGAVSMLVECQTDNLNRTLGNIRAYLNKTGGSLANKGSFDFTFVREGVFSIPQSQVQDEDSFSLDIIDAGAEEVELNDERYIVVSNLENFGAVQKKLDELGIEPENAGLKRRPRIYKSPSREDLEKLNKLIDMLEDDDDIQQVYHNLEPAEN